VCGRARICAIGERESRYYGDVVVVVAGRSLVHC
jgi:hypothetical protein